MSTDNSVQILKSLPTIYDTLMNQLHQQEGGPEMPIKSLPSLSNKIMGLSRQRLYVIGGRTSQGKTTLAMQIAMDQAKQGRRVFFLSLEMDEQEILLRMLSNMCDIDANELRFNISQKRYLTDQISDFFKNKDTDGKLLFPMLLTYNIGLTVNDLHELIADLEKPDLVIVDYIQAIRKLDFDKLTTMNNYITEFRSMCVEQDFCGILVSQINRSAMEDKAKKPFLWQLKGSGTIEEHADVVMLCHWDYFYTSDPNTKSVYDICIAKNRQGVTSTVSVDYKPECYKFKDAGTPLMSSNPLIKSALKTFGGKVINADRDVRRFND